MRPGAIFAGDFQLERKLGEGGMGAVYVAMQRSTGVRRALKVMGATVLQNPKAWERFEQEARISARIRSDHVVKVITAGIEPSLQIPFLVMELLEGQTLDGVLQRGPVGPSEAGVLLGQLCHGLAEMHRLGIVHRDIKPENIFIASANRADTPFTVKLLDFGIAKELTGLASSGVTQAVGTPRTMAPEQADPRQPITPATDVWALGLVAFHLLTGRSFWLSANHPNGTLQGLLAEVMNLPIPPPSERGAQLSTPALPAGFDGWFLRCLERDPARRFADAAAAWASLSSVLGAPPPSSGPGSLAPGALSAAISVRPPAAGQTAALPFAVTAPPPLGPGGTAIAATAPAAPPTGAASAISPPAKGTPSRRQRLAALLGGAAVGAVVVVGALAVWMRGRVEYCQEIVVLRDDVECAGRISLELARRRGASFSLERRSGKARRATLVNGAGQPVEGEGGASEYLYEYEGKRLSSIRAYGPRGELLLTQAVRPDGRHEARGPGGEARLFPGGHHGVIEYEYDEARRPRRARYLTANGQPASDGGGAFGHEYRFDAQGFEVERVTLGPDGKPSIDDRWVVRQERRRDGRGYAVEERFFGPDGPARPKEGCARVGYTHDEAGNVTRAACQDAEGKPAAHPEGYWGWSARHDGRGNQVEVRRFGPDGVTTHDRRGVAIEQLSYDDRGRVVELKLLLPDGSPAQDHRGISGYRARHDEQGNLIEKTFTDAAGNPAFCADGYATVRLRHDKQRRPVEEAYFDPEGRPTYSSEGAAAVKITHDERGREIERSYLDVDGKPTLCAGRYAALRLVYDEQGRLKEERFQGLDGKPTRTAGWYAARLHRYDDRGNEVETSWQGPDGKPTRTREGVSAERRKFNERGQVVEVQYIGPGGAPTFHARGAAGQRMRHDAQGRLVERSNLDAAGRLAPDDEGEVQERLTLDDRGNTIERAFYDAFGKPAVSRVEGYAARKARLSERGYPEEYVFLGANGEATKNPGGSEIERFAYDERGNQVERALLDAQGKPAEEGGVSIFRWKHGAQGDIVEWAHLSAEGRPTRGRDGYAVARTTTDGKGRQLSWVYLDAEGHPTRYRGHARSQASYDPKGRKIEANFLDETGAPTNLEGKGVPTIRYGYDERGNLAHETLVAADGGAPRLAVVRREFRYNDRDLLVEVRPFGPDGQPPADHLMVRTEYDDRGQRVELAYYDATGQRAAAASGVSVERLTRDERGQVVERSFFDHQLRPVMNREFKAARMRYTHDDAGRKRGEDCFDDAGKLIRTIRFGDRGDEPKRPPAQP